MMGSPYAVMLKLGVSLLVSSLIAPAIAHAQGFGIYEQGACVMSRGGAGVADPCHDGSAIYVNPAGLFGESRIVVGGGATIIFGSGRFTGDTGPQTDLKRSVSFPPHIYFQYRLAERVAIGAGFYVPYGLGVEWPLDFAGRFVAHDANLTTTYFQPTVAFAPTRSIALGAGLTVATGSVKLARRQDLAAIPLGTVPGLTFGALVQDQTDFLDTELEASGARGIGANLGVAVTVNDGLRLGARYLTPVTLTYRGDAVFTPIVTSYRVTKPNVLGLPVGFPLDDPVSQVQAAFQNQPVTTELTMPAQFVAGLSARVTDRVKILADYQWVGWSAFDTVTIAFSSPVPPTEQLEQGYRNTSAIRIGLEFTAAPRLRLSGGFFSNQAAAPDETVTPLLPEARRNHFTAGAGWRPSASVSLDLAYQFVHHADRRGRVVNPAAGEPPTTALNSGTYRSRASLLGITLTFRR